MQPLGEVRRTRRPSHRRCCRARRDPNPNPNPNPGPNPNPNPNPYPNTKPSPHPNPNPNQVTLGFEVGPDAYEPTAAEGPTSPAGYKAALAAEMGVSPDDVTVLAHQNDDGQPWAWG